MNNKILVFSIFVFTTCTVNAALPAAATSALSSITSGISDAEKAVWPLIGAALVAGIIIKLVKRFSNKI